MKYDTSPLSIDTLDVESTPPSNELRFAPIEDNIHQTNGAVGSESGPISQITVLSQNVGFDTFIENRHDAGGSRRLNSLPELKKYRSWVMAGLLAVISAVGGGATVYFLSTSLSPPITQQQSDAANPPVTDVQPADTFIVKFPTERAAEEPLVPHSPEGSINHGRPVHLTRMNSVRDHPNANTSTTIPETFEPATNVGQNSTTDPVAEPQPQKPEREAKVGGYVVEKPAIGRRPIARCADGTYSFSASKAAACAGRGGVSDWMADGKPATTTPAKQAAYVLGPRGGCYYLDSSNKKVYVEKKFCQ